MAHTAQPRCHLCGNAAKYAFAYARFNERDTFLGVIYRGVCGQCLGEYIESVKRNRHVRGELFLWPLLFLPFGVLLAAFCKNVIGWIAGALLIAFALCLPVIMRRWYTREAKRASLACEADNEAKYSERFCREDAMRTSRQAKLIHLRPEYLTDAYDAVRIAEETGVSLGAAAFLKTIAQKMLGAKPLFQAASDGVRV